MFLYRRAAAPTYGFFVLNRNGVENFSAPLTHNDDLDLTDEFIIYRPADSGASGAAAQRERQCESTADLDARRTPHARRGRRHLWHLGV